ncbi:MAG: glycoside hydrolase family 3 C-terminal domain-containing protein [Chloroflexota bacterium]
MAKKPTNPQPSTLDRQVDSLLEQMTLQEKIALLSGLDTWKTVPIPRLGIPSIVMTDGPHGVRSDQAGGRPVGPTTCFPTGISMGAAWNPELVAEVGGAIAEETRAMDCDIILGPCVNIVREPRGGRNFETYAEDPYLAGKTAIGYINGVQSKKIGTSLKHYAVNNYEIERDRASSNLDERTLREIYLSQFEMAVKETQPWTVMCSYNRINGVYASQHDYLLNEILKEEWGFEGLVVSDWGANHTIFSSVAGGLDLEMPGPAKYYKLLNDAVRRWQIDEAAVSEAARRVLRVVLLSGRMDGSVSQGAVNTPEHQALARRLAEEAITLLKNDGGILPIDPAKIKTIAVIGPNAAQAVIEGGGSSHVDPPYRISPLEALQARLGDKVTLLVEQGCDNFDQPPSIPLDWVAMPDGSGPGMHVDVYRDAAGFDGPVESSLDNHRPEFWWWLQPADKPEHDHFATRWTGKLIVPTGGNYTFQLRHGGQVRVILAGEIVADSAAPNIPTEAGWDTAQGHVTFEKALEAGKSYELCIEYTKYPGQNIVSYHLAAAILYKPGEDPRPARAIAAAQKADLVLAFVGYQEGFESEGWDRPTIELPGGQNELLAAVAAVNPRTVVVLNAGAPVAMPWVDAVASIVEAYYPGQENGNAVASILLGETNPSGKLPITFPKKIEDNPAFINVSHPGCRAVSYGEGIFVGYRYYDKKAVEPLFPFGHGLSYTTFEYRSASEVQRASKDALDAGETIAISLTVENTGRVAGQEVVQLYVADPESSLPRPPKELKGFAKVALQPGERKVVTFELDQRSFAFYDPYQKAWVAETGEYEILFASSSRDVRAKVTVALE